VSTRFWAQDTGCGINDPVGDASCNRLEIVELFEKVVITAILYLIRFRGITGKDGAANQVSTETRCRAVLHEIKKLETVSGGDILPWKYFSISALDSTFWHSASAGIVVTMPAAIS